MSVTEVLHALGSFEFELIEAVPRDVIDTIDYFGHIAIVPGRMDPKEYGDNTLSAARYVGVIRRKKLADDGRTNLVMDDTRINGVGMNFWLGDEDGKGEVLETPLTFTNSTFSSAITALAPDSVPIGTIYSVPGSYSGRHVYEIPRTSIQYVCDTMSSGGTSRYDTFNRGNTTTNLGQLDSGETWTQNTGTWGIISNSGYISASGVNSIASISVASSFDAQITVQTITAGKAYLLFRMSDTANYWRFGSSTATGAIVLSKIVAGVATPVVTLSNLMANSTTLRVVASGDNIYVYVNGTLWGQTNDAYLNTATKIGMNCDDITTRWETFNASPERSPVSYRVNNDGTLDAGLESSLYVTNPTCVIIRKGTTYGEDMTMRALPTSLDLDMDMEDFSTRTVMLAEANGESIATGSADIAVVAPGINVYKDIHGNTLKMTRMISESDTLEQNADVRAELALRNFTAQNRNLTLATDDFDIYGSFKIGDYVYLYDPDAGLHDERYEVTIRGARINPVKLQVTETDWPVTDEYTVAYRGGDGTWLDLTDYIHFDKHTTSKVIIGDFQRQLTDAGQSVAQRVGSLTQADNTIPAAPAWVTASFQTIVYLDGIGNVKAQQKLAWATPFNVDGTNIIDGDRYEIQFRLNTGHLYSQTWGAASTLTWSQMQTWDQPVAPDAGQWESRFVQWGDNSLIIGDLAAGTNYDFRIRAIDSGNNTSAWSANSTQITATDTIPPSTPNAPTVAGSLIAIQVTHDLGVATGGSFNLENDLAYLEVHAEYEPLYTPTSATKLGNLRANRGMMSAHTPAIATFPVAQTVPVYVKVVAVDMSGNRSSPSIPAVVTADLIDDQYISNLSVSKLLAGEILADWIISGSIKTATSGNRVEIDYNGVRSYDTDELNTFNLSSVDGSVSMVGDVRSNNYLEGSEGWHIGADGVTQFQNLNVLSDVTGINGYFDNVYNSGVLMPTAEDLAAFYQAPKPVIKVHHSLSGFTTNATPATWTIMPWDFAELSVNSATDMWSSANPNQLVAPVDGIYRVNYQVQWVDGAASHSSVVEIRKDSGGNETVGNRLAENYSSAPGTFRTDNSGSFTVYMDAGSHLEMYVRSIGNQLTLQAGNGGTAYMEMAFESKIAMGSGPGGPPSIQTLTVNEVWCRTFDGTNAERSPHNDTQAYQGRFDGTYGQQKSQIGFTNSGSPTTITSILAGKTIVDCVLKFKVKHSYNGTMDVSIGTHNNLTAPAPWPGTGVVANRVLRTGAATGGTYQVSLGATIGAEFQAGTIKGITFGPAPGSSTSFQYYGYMYGDYADTTTSPKLIITYY